MRIMTLNCNGIRAAHRKGFFEWAQQADCDIICLQEVRADQSVLAEQKFVLDGYQAWHKVATKKGYSGVSVYARIAVDAVCTEAGHDVLDDEGRWLSVKCGNLNIVSLYLPSGSSGEAAQHKKDILLQWMLPKMQAWSNQGEDWVICADWNIAHTQKDIKNWRANQKNSGFLPHERQWVTDVLAMGWVDVFRQLNQQDHQYTWWSNRGKAWDNNTGWRLDYQLVYGSLAQRAKQEWIYKQQRFSDHAPLIIEYE